ncbi:phospholipid scramblase-related protein [Fulvivirga sp.]|uniref:phospholipid scramblase-related protein n=1 Tax=Fulvivirga sp. TaxID=1931237 RepID=UPI0032EF27E3
MHPVFNRNLFFVKEQVGMFKASNNYDIYDPETKEVILECREPNLGFFTKMFRFTDYKRMTPFEVVIKEPNGDVLITVKRGVSIFLSTVEVFDEKDQLIGKFKQQFFSIGGKFNLLDQNDSVVSTLKGKWTSWDFKFVKEGHEFAHVSKQWAGFGKELFTSADNYMLQIHESVPENNRLRMLIISAVMCIDMVLKE